MAIKSSYTLENQIRNIPKSAMNDTEQIERLADYVGDFIETLRNDLDYLTNVKPEDRIESLELKLSEIKTNLSKLLPVVESMAKRQNALAEQVEKMERVFNFIMERKEQKGNE